MARQSQPFPCSRKDNMTFLPHLCLPLSSRKPWQRHLLHSLWEGGGNPSILSLLQQDSGKARGRSSVWSLTALFRWICNPKILENATQKIAKCIQKDKTCLQAGSSFLCHNPSEDRHTRRTLLLTASGSGELEEGMVAGGCIFLLSAGAVPEGTGGAVRLSVSAELIVSLTIVLDVFSRLIN